MKIITAIDLITIGYRYYIYKSFRSILFRSRCLESFKIILYWLTIFHLFWQNNSWDFCALEIFTADITSIDIETIYKFWYWVYYTWSFLLKTINKFIQFVHNIYFKVIFWNQMIVLRFELEHIFFNFWSITLEYKFAWLHILANLNKPIKTINSTRSLIYLYTPLAIFLWIWITK